MSRGTPGSRRQRDVCVGNLPGARLRRTLRLDEEHAYAWMKSTFEKIAAGRLQSQIQDILPWNFGPAND